MSQVISSEQIRKSVPTEHLHINVQKESVSASIVAYMFKDKDTHQMVLYIPSLEVSAYGDTVDKAKEMAELSIKDCFSFLRSMSSEDLKAYLLNLGWKRGVVKKTFSRNNEMDNNELSEFNAIESTIERLMLTAA
jgi:hypothetical protein